MLSHDNVTWSTQICTEHYQWNNETHLSYLPMCHVAPLMIDGYIIPCCGGTAFIADKNALKGTLVIFIVYQIQINDNFKLKLQCHYIQL